MREKSVGRVDYYTKIKGKDTKISYMKLQVDVLFKLSKARKVVANKKKIVYIYNEE